MKMKKIKHFEPMGGDSSYKSIDIQLGNVGGYLNEAIEAIAPSRYKNYIIWSNVDKHTLMKLLNKANKALKCADKLYTKKVYK